MGPIRKPTKRVGVSTKAFQAGIPNLRSENQQELQPNSGGGMEKTFHADENARANMQKKSLHICGKWLSTARVYERYTDFS